MLEADDLRARDARRTHPRGQAQGDEDGADVRAQQHHQQNGVQKRGQRDEDIHNAHHDVVHHAATEARDAAVEHTDDHVHQRGNHADRQADARAVEHADVEVAPERVRAEPVRRAGPLVDVEEVRVLIAVGAEHRAEDGEERDDGDDDEAEDGELVALEAPPCVLPVGDGRAGNLVGGQGRGVKRRVAVVDGLIHKQSS